MAEVLNSALVEQKSEIKHSAAVLIRIFHAALQLHDGCDVVVRFNVKGALDGAAAEMLDIFLEENGFSLSYDTQDDMTTFKAVGWPIAPEGPPEAWRLLWDKRAKYPQTMFDLAIKEIVDMVQTMKYPGRLRGKYQLREGFYQQLNTFDTRLRDLTHVLKTTHGIFLRILNYEKRIVEVLSMDTRKMLKTFMQDNEIK